MDMNDLNISTAQKAKRFFTIPRAIFAILGVIILIEIIYAVRVLTFSPPVSPPPVPQPGAQLTGGKIILAALRSTYKVNDVVSVSVSVDSGGHLLDGIDLIVRFDPKILEASRSGMIRGKIFDEYPYSLVDTKNGLIAISGINSVKKGFKGTGQFAILNLRVKEVKAPVTTSLTVDFKKDSTTNSNLVETDTSKNILEQVGNLELNVQ